MVLPITSLVSLALALAAAAPPARQLAQEPAQEPEPPPTAALQRPAPTHRFRLELEAGATWQSRNDVQIPSDTGTRFSLIDYQGGGPFPVGRVTFDADVTPRHGLRLVYQPLRIDETGTSSQDVRFEGQDFAAGVPTDARYQFDTWRLVWRYRFHQSERWEWRAGVTLLLRDAEIALAQPGVASARDDLGLVPLLHVDGSWRFAERWRALLEFDGLAAPQGRAFDLALKVGYDLSERWTVAAGYRTIEGGADNDEVYNFAWFHSAVVSASYRF